MAKPSMKILGCLINSYKLKWWKINEKNYYDFPILSQQYVSEMIKKSFLTETETVI